MTTVGYGDMYVLRKSFHGTFLKHYCIPKINGKVLGFASARLQYSAIRQVIRHRGPSTQLLGSPSKNNGEVCTQLPPPKNSVVRNTFGPPNCIIWRTLSNSLIILNFCQFDIFNSSKQRNIPNQIYLLVFLFHIQCT